MTGLFWHCEPVTDLPANPTTLSIDCGGTGLKAAVLDTAGAMISERVRVPVPYPLTPARFVRELVDLTRGLPAYDRVTAGLPGMIRHGTVIATPHYPTVAGPFTPVDPELLRAWTGFPAATALAQAFDRPVLVLNDAQVQGASVVQGRGVELVLTLGTGLGFALFDEGQVTLDLELSHHRFRQGQTYDQQLGDHARRAVGEATWNRRVGRAIEGLRPVICFDRLYLGGGNAKRLRLELPADVVVAENINGILGGARVWDLLAPTP